MNAMGAVSYWRLSSAYFFYFAYVGVFSPYFPLYLQSLQFSAADIGVILSLTQFTRVVGPGLWGSLEDRFSRRGTALQACAWLGVVASTGMLMGTSFVWLAGVLLLQSMATSGAMPIVEASTLSQLGGAAGRYGAIRVWGSVGFIAAVFGIGGALDAIAIDWLPYLVIASLLLFAFASMAVPEPGAHGSHDQDSGSIRDVVRLPHVAALLAACFFMALAHGTLYTFYTLFLVEQGYSKTAVGLLWSVGVAAEIGVFLLLPKLMARHTLRVILLASFACAVLRFAAIGWGVASVVVLIAAQVLHGATFGSYHAAAVAATHRFFPGRLHARGQALYTAVSFGAGGMLGGILSGWCWDVIGAAWTFSMSSAMAAIGLLCVWSAFHAGSSNK